MVNVSESLDIDKILEYSEFDDSAQQSIIAADGFESHDDILTLRDSYIVNPEKGFSDRTVAAGKIRFGLRWTNLLKATFHWDQDFRKISRKTSIIGIINNSKFRAEIEAARQRARIRKHGLEESASLNKATDPGKLKQHNDWITWSMALNNYLSIIIFQDRVPLIYVIRECAAPDYAIELQSNYDFEQLSINCVPLAGLTYKTYSRKLHKLIHGFLQGETAETWINPKDRKQDGRLEYLALLAHYGGEGNKAVRLK